MRIPFLRRRRKTRALPPAQPKMSPDSLSTHEHALRLQYHAKSGDGVRLIGEVRPPDLPALLDGIAISPVELVAPLSPETQDAAPHIIRPNDALMWINAHHHYSPVTRHALYVFEAVDAIDTAYETLAVGLLQGQTDSEGVPRFDAIVGGLVSFWDETTGELVIRPLVGWGGEGSRSDTDRTAQRLLARLMSNVLASQGAHGVHVTERPIAVGGARTCPHCGFAMLDPAAHYCPKCGMRQSR